MRFLLILIFTLFSRTTALAFSDFIKFENPYNNSIQNSMSPQMRYDYGNNYNTTWANPYEVSTKTLSKAISSKKINNKALKMFNSISQDYEYILSKMERQKFGKEYPNLNIESRLDRLEEDIFGASQNGDYTLRLNRLKRAISAETTRSYKAKENRLKEFFASGYPTSIPVNRDFYSFLNDDFEY